MHNSRSKVKCLYVDESGSGMCDVEYEIFVDTYLFSTWKRTKCDDS